MEVFKGKVIGIGRGVGKESKKPFLMLHVAGKPFTDNQFTNGSAGAQVTTYFVDANLASKIDNSMIGKEYTISSIWIAGKDNLCNIEEI